MTFVARIDVLTAELPFRFSFGHARAARRSSTNVYVRMHLDDGTVGYGEGVPREYVTGETVETAVDALAEHLGPALAGHEIRDPDAVPTVFDDALGPAAASAGPTVDLAARCALELAFLDACGRHFGCSVRAWLAPAADGALRYDAVIPFFGPGTLAAIALAVKAAHIDKVKIKVGTDLDADLRALRLLRRVLGADADVRVDANAAWTADQALAAIEQMRRYRISAVEQPVAATDIDGLVRLTAATPEKIIVDESLALARAGACDAFNIRVSKCGGLLRSRRIAQIAAEHELACVVGAQVGESGLLSAAGRHLAASIRPRYLEGSAGRLLLRRDLTQENVMPGWGGRARPYNGAGLGVRVREDVLATHARAVRTVDAGAMKVR
jgi:L-Ala-D/L-Glu epimerase